MPRLRLALVGTGRAAAGLAPLLSQGGAELVAVVGRSPEGARRIARLARPPGVPLQSAPESEGPQALALADLPAGLAELGPPDGWILAVSDDAIAEVDERLAEKAAYAGARWASHLSGALPAAHLAAARRAGLAAASLHPLWSFPPVPLAEPRPEAGGGRGREAGLDPGPPLFVLEGDPAALADLTAWLDALGAHSARIAPDAKPVYHAAASLAANLSLALLALSAELAATAGLPPDEAERALARLAAGAMANAARLGAAEALTGPIRRGDLGTVRRHLRALAPLPSRFRDAYATLGLEAVRLARLSGSPPETLAAIEAELRRAREGASGARANLAETTGGGSA